MYSYITKNATYYHQPPLDGPYNAQKKYQKKKEKKKKNAIDATCKDTIDLHVLAGGKADVKRRPSFTCKT